MYLRALGIVLFKVSFPLGSEPVNFGFGPHIFRGQQIIFDKLLQPFIDTLTSEFDVCRNLIRRQYGIGGIVKYRQDFIVRHTPRTPTRHGRIRTHDRINSNYLDISRHVVIMAVNIMVVAPYHVVTVAYRPGAKREGSNGPRRDRCSRASMLIEPHNCNRTYGGGDESPADSTNRSPDAREVDE